MRSILLKLQSRLDDSACSIRVLFVSSLYRSSAFRLNTKSIGLAPCHLPSDLIEIYSIVKLLCGVACRVIWLRLFRSSFGTVRLFCLAGDWSCVLWIAGLFTIGGPSRWWWLHRLCFTKVLLWIDMHIVLRWLGFFWFSSTWLRFGFCSLLVWLFFQVASHVWAYDSGDSCVCPPALFPGLFQSPAYVICSS